MELDAVAIIATLTTVACVLGIFAAAFTIFVRQDGREENTGPPERGHEHDASRLEARPEFSRTDEEDGATVVARNEHLDRWRSGG